MKIYSGQKEVLVEEKSDELLRSFPPKKALWIDLLLPTDEEKRIVEQFLSIQIPSKEEMHEIESSSRVYKENDALIMTANLLKLENGGNHIVNTSFILKGNVLVTVRYEEVSSLALFLKLVTNKPPFPVDHALSLLLGMLEAVIEKIADTLENISYAMETLSRKIFVEKSDENPDLKNVLITTGLQGEINSKTRDCLSSITRIVGYLKFNLGKTEEKLFNGRVETLSLDALDLKDQSAFLSHKVSFMIDASLGLINVQQNTIIKIFSIAAVVLLPPTLVASVYGMNFKTMPELNWKLGYPIALFLMLLSAVLPYFYFKCKKWL